MLTPPRALRPGGHIAVLAPSSPSPLARIERAAAMLECRGFRVSLAANIDRGLGSYLAGSDEERLAELNHYFNSSDVDAFFFARGGYGAMRILDRIDFGPLVRDPRPVVGFSDITAIHQAMAARAGLAGFHGPMLNLDFHDGLSPDIEQWFWSMLAGDAPLSRVLPPDAVVVEGEAEGPLFGGCLSLTTALTGTPYDFWIDGGIWFWEDVDEPLYRVDRMLTHLRLSGRISRVRGVVVGALKDCGQEGELLGFLRDFFSPFGVPVVRNLPFGHHGDNILMPIGRNATISTPQQRLIITEPAVVR